MTEFTASQGQFDTIVSWLSGPDASGLTHSQLEDHLAAQGREQLRLLLQDYLDLRAHDEPRLAEVADASGVARTTAEPSRRRLATSSGRSSSAGWPTGPPGRRTCIRPTRR